MTMKKDEKYITLPITIAFFLFVAYIIVDYVYNQQSLKENAKNESATIKEFTSSKNGHYFIYQFNINGNEYKGRGTYYPNGDKLSIGDTISIVYDKTNPANNQSIRDFEKKIDFFPLFIIIPIMAILSFRFLRKK
jgi:hypothetical protein